MVLGPASIYHFLTGLKLTHRITMGGNFAKWPLQLLCMVVYWKRSVELAGMKFCETVHKTPLNGSSFGQYFFTNFLLCIQNISSQVALNPIFIDELMWISSIRAISLQPLNKNYSDNFENRNDKYSSQNSTCKKYKKNIPRPALPGLANTPTWPDRESRNLGTRCCL